MLRSVYEAVEHSITIVNVLEDGEFRFVGWNPATERITGIPSQTIVGKTPEELMGQEHGAIVRQDYQRCLEAGTSVTYEEYLPFDGQDFWWLTTLNPLKDDCGTIHRIVVTAMDITDRKLAEAALQQKESHYRSIFETINDGINITELETGKLVSVNPAVCKMYGYTAEEFLTLSPPDYVHPDCLTRFAGFVETIRAGDRFFAETVNLHKNGTCIDIEVTAVPFSYNNRPHALSIVRDISDRKAAEAALQQRVQREKLLNRITSQVRCSLDFDTILTTAVEEIRKFMQVNSCSFAWYCPDAAEPYWEAVKQATVEKQPSLLGRYSVAALGSLADQLLVLDTVCIEDVSQVEDATVQQLFDGLGYSASLSLPMQIPSGLIGVLGCQNRSPRCWTDDEVELLQAVMEQLTIALNQAELYNQSQIKAQELEQALQKLQHTQLQMIQSEKMSSLGQLVAGIAHEINNPVNFIYGNIFPAEQYMQDLLDLIHCYQTHSPAPLPAIQKTIEAIDLEFVEGDLPRLLASIKMGAERIRQIVSSLRTFSRLDEAECKAVDLHEGIDSTLVILENRLKASPESPGVQVIKQYGDLPQVECYAGQLNQVFMNILVNALDALEERDQHRSPQQIAETPSTIVIRTEKPHPDWVAIHLMDNGPGMPETVKQRIFDPFFTTKPIGKGTGIGMSISYQIITENHRGTIRCLSTPGQGAEFVIEIPLKQTTPRA
jgi:PAS domain S-box-containing protein